MLLGVKRIEFYSVGDAYGEFSNFAEYPVRIDGETWQTTEHYFQAQKFADATVRARVRRTRTPEQAANLGRDRSLKLRRDWESAKVDVMRTALRAKFKQHANLAALLLSTGDALLVERSDSDSYWGDGEDGRGRNMLGRLLMELRNELRAAADGRGDG